MNERVWGWAGSPDAERWFGAHATRGAAIADARASGDVLPDDAVYVRSGRKPRASEFVPDLYILTEAMGDAAYEEAGEAAEEFPGVDDAAHDELRALIEAWAERHCDVTFWIADGEPERIEPEARP